MKTLFFISFITIINTVSLAQLTIEAPKHLLFTQLTSQQGLPENTVIDIDQDKQGFIWLATTSGLVRYDGYRTKLFRQDSATTSLSSSYVTSILNDSQGHMWVGTNEGLNLYNPRAETFNRYYLTPPSSHTKEIDRTNWIWRLFEDSKAQIWIASRGGLYCLTKLPGSSNQYKKTKYILPGKGGCFVQYVCEDNQGRIWVATDKGLFSLAWQQGKLKTGIYNRKTTPSFVDDNVTALLFDDQNRLWAGTEKGYLYVLTGNKWKLVDRHTDKIRDLTLDLQGVLGVAAGKDIFAYKDGIKQKVVLSDPSSKGLSGQTILCFFRDKAGAIWFGTDTDGAGVISMNAPLLTTYPVCNLDRPQVNCVWALPNNRLLLGTQIGVCELEHDPLVPTKQWVDNRIVLDIIQTKDQAVWAATSQGLKKLSLQGVGSVLYKDSALFRSGRILALLEDRQRNLWLATEQGLVLFDRSTQTFRLPFPAFKNKFTGHLFQDSRGNMWVNTRDGVHLIKNELRPRIISFPIPHERFVSGRGRPICITEDSRGRIWVGYNYEQSLAYFSPQDQRFHQLKLDGLPDQAINIVEEKDNVLWVSSAHDIYRLNLNDSTLTKYNYFDGVPGYDIIPTSVRRVNNLLYWGTNKGLISIDPSKVSRNMNPPKVVITSIGRPNQSAEKATVPLVTDSSQSGYSFEIAYQDRSFTLNFAGLSFVQPFKNRYAYQLDNTSWQYLPTPQIPFNNLEPGQYQLRLKAANNDGVWSAPVLVDLNIKSPWWWSWWAILLYISIIGGFIGAILRLFYLWNKAKSEKNLYADKLTFLNHLSHEIRTQLMEISLPAEQLMDAQLYEQESVATFAYAIQKNVDRLLRLINELLNVKKAEEYSLLIRPEGHRFLPILQLLVDSYKDIFESTQIQTSINSGNVDPDQILWLDLILVEKALYNLLSAIYRLTPKKGYVYIMTNDAGDTIRITFMYTSVPLSEEDRFTDYFSKAINTNLKTSQFKTDSDLDMVYTRRIVEQHGGSLSSFKSHSGSANVLVNGFVITARKGNSHLDQFIHTNQAWLTRLNQHKNAAESNKLDDKYTLLLVINHQDFSDHLVNRLATHYQVNTCFSGIEALRQAQQVVPDLIIIDVSVPDINGFNLSAMLKKELETSHIPIILLLPSDLERYRLLSLKQGADLYLIKPFQQEILELHIQNILFARETFQKQVSRALLQEPKSSDNQTEEPFLQAIVEFIEANISNPDLTIKMVARHIGVSEPVLYRKLRAQLGITVNDFIKKLKLKRAAELLSAGHSHTEVSIEVGYSDAQYFSREFKKQYGITPAKWMQHKP